MSLDDHIRALAEALDAQGWPVDSPWLRAAVLQAARRHVFAPDRLWEWDGHHHVPVDRAQDPDRWASLVYAGPDEPTLTQITDGLPSSSLSAPSIVIDMLDSLMPEPGHHVLELGTGYGWNAALLAHRAGPGRVVSVETDPGLAAAAHRRLTEHGFDVTVLTGDGDLGAPGHRPFDRVIATYAVEQIPWAWIEQCSPGARIVTPWGRLGHVALTVADDSGSATGWVQGLATFMPRRGTGQGHDFHDLHTTIPTSSTSTIPAEDVHALRDASLIFSLRVTHPDVRITTALAPDGQVTAHAHDGHTTWATATTRPDGHARVEQGGPCSLMTEISQGYQHWQDRGAPSLWDFGMTVEPGRQYIWCKTPQEPWES
ncbi:methyltransferase domain-containing protein [Streptomyces sp. NBC_00237]|uniref:protein-L-isoaspartate O-methyltransferase family protein n=1 Tax=Streptomyces sp. NBC_00237 TaxID=2975687 RepID=UPI00225611CB|nr:methyltransferase domain-containing protein [Streptomyces sp. NBC_00237]MCX5205832.1 methyltransferase domain-containing protein [Streptomyces sp. NBC_00237]